MPTPTEYIKGSQLPAVDDGDFEDTDTALAIQGGTTKRGLFSKLAEYVITRALAFIQAGTDAVARTMLDKARESISVLDFIPPAEHAAIRAYTSTYDCTAGIQAAIDYVMYGGGRGRVVIPPGKYRTTDTIHLGYGNTFKSVVVEGDGYNYRADAGFNGVAIVPDFNDRPAINIQGARGTVLRGVTIRGKNFEWISTRNLGASAPALDDTDPASWVDTAFPTSADSRYAPYAAITIDAYSGVQPGVSYPSVDYPAFLGAVAQYGKSFSSDVLIEDCMITGFVAGIVIQPCDADGNADFTVIRRVNMEKVKWGISIGNTQSRNVNIDNVKIGQFYCALANSVHGRRVGKFNGTISNLSAGSGIKILEFGAGIYAGPVTFLHLYCEAVWRIGDINATSSNENSFIFQSCLFNFSNQTNARGIPPNILSGGQQAVEVRFVGCQFTQFPSVIGVNQFGGARMEGSTVSPSTRDSGTLSSEYLALAHNALCGGVVFPQIERLRGQRIKFKAVNIDTRAVGSGVFCEEGYKLTSRTHCIPIYPWEVQASSESYSDAVRTPRGRFTQAKSGLTSCTLSDRTLTIQFASRTDWQFMLWGPDCGDIIFDDLTGMVFFVRSRTGTVVIAEAQNNYKDNGLGGFTTVTAFSTSTGNFYFASGRFYTPQYYLRGDITSGNATIANCARDDSFAAWYDAQIAVDDYLWVTDSQDRVMGVGTGLRVAARDQAASTITMAGTFSRTETRRRLSLFVRKPPANV